MSSVHKLAVILFADIQGYTALMQKDEEAAMVAMSRFKLVLEAETIQANGKVIQYFGDGALLTFESAASAVSCAMAMQSAFLGEPFVPVRIGVHLGDVVFKEGNIFGDGVNVASRIESLGVPGAVLMSKAIRNQLKNKAGFQLASLGQFAFKNVEEPMEVFALANEGFVIPEAKKLQGKGKKVDDRLLPKYLNWLIGLVALILISLFLWNQFYTSDDIPQFQAPKDSISRIVILPFDNFSPDTNDVYFADGMMDEIISKLSKINQFRVIARSSSMSYKGSKKSAAVIGEELRVGHLLEGSVKKAGSRLRVSVKLVDTQTQTQIWAEQYDKQLTDIFEIQDSISLAVASSLQQKLLGKEKASLITHPTENLEAYNLYLQGRFQWNKRTPEGLTSSISYFEQALSKDSSFALAYSGLADVYMMQGFWSLKTPHEVYPVAKDYLKKALQLNPMLAEALTSEAFIATVYDWDWEKANKNFSRALQINPSHAIAHQWYSEYLMIQNLKEESIAEISKAQTLDPLSQIITSVKGEFLRYNREFDKAFLEYKKALELNPNFAVSYTHRAGAYTEIGKFEEALADAKKGVELADNALFAQGILGYVHAASGEVQQAEKILNELILKSKDQSIGHIYISIIYLELEMEEEAILWFQKAMENRSSIMWFVWRSGIFKKYQNHPQFRVLLEQAGLQ